MSESEGKRRQLGRGLNALLGEDGADYASLDRIRSTKTVPIEFIEPSPRQPRRNFDPADMEALAISIKDKGVLQPILVRRHANDPARYELVAGERRWRAAQAAQLHEIPVIIKDLSDQEALEIALVENIQRRDLGPLEEAEGYQRLMEDFSHTQDGLARVVGKSRSHVANTLRLLGLPDAVKEMVDKGELTAGHARALLNAEAPEEMARKIVAGGLNVRQAERLVRSARRRGERAAAPDAAAAPDTAALESELSDMLGLKVWIRDLGGGKGQLVIGYGTLEQLDDVLQRLSRRAI